MSAVTLVHDAAAGRTRFRVEAMRSAPALARVLEEQTLLFPGVLEVTANPLTGSLLVRYDPAVTGSAILLSFIGALVDSAPWAQGAPPRQSGTGASKTARRRKGRDANQDSEPWHRMSADLVAAKLKTSLFRGLTSSQASRRLGRYGRNEVPDIPRRPRGAILTDQLISAPGVMLSAAAVFSMITGAVTDALFISGALVGNVALGFFTEDYAERTIQSLRQVGAAQARILRDGRRSRIPIEEVAPGDILILEPGHVAAADGRLIRVEKLVMDESLLTGESVGQPKTVSSIDQPELPIADRANMIYAGSAVSSGRGAAVVTATGLHTELGRIRTLIRESPDTPPPMSRELQRLGSTLAMLSVGVCAGFGALGILFGLPPVQVLAVMASLAVSAIPEGLPTVATTTLALGMKRLRESNVVIRRLPAAAALGSATVLCVDKTGTLTENRMSVRCFVLNDAETEIAETADNVRCVRHGQYISPQDDPALLSAMQVGALCTEAELTPGRDGGWDAIGSSTEQALLLTAIRAGVDVPRFRTEMQTHEIQERSPGRNYMISLHDRLDGGTELLVKGAPEEVIALCSAEVSPDGMGELSPRRQIQLLEWNERLAGRGLRVLGLARTVLQPGEVWNGSHRRLAFVGLVGLDDPVRGGAREAVEQLARAGIRTIMLTGDQRITAASVGRAIGLGNGSAARVANAAAIQESLASGQPLPDVLARVSPDQKYTIVRLLQDRGHVVMMTGDGINDAPALKAADVGVAMGARSTQVARDLADVILLDDNLGNIPVAVSQGRTIFDNIRKSLRFLLASNLSDIGLVGASLLLRSPFPLTALHLLWMNLVTDVFPAIALALEHPEPDVMLRPPRPPGEPLLTRSLWRLVGREAAVIAAATYGTYAWSLSRYGAGARSRTVAFNTITMSQILYALACRSERPGIAGAGGQGNRYLLSCLGISAAAQALTTLLPPLRLLLGTTPLSASDWIAVATGSGAVIGLTEGLKMLPSPGPRQIAAGNASDNSSVLPLPAPFPISQRPAEMRG
ncbi:MAG TPA: HAD-IC family P-type ATPase [Armatimonadota bacterium]|nr:HAD-IC family P-type ATPase [Armatimonadota bacterium]